MSLAEESNVTDAQESEEKVVMYCKKCLSAWVSIIRNVQRALIILGGLICICTSVCLYVVRLRRVGSKTTFQLRANR